MDAYHHTPSTAPPGRPRRKRLTEASCTSGSVISSRNLANSASRASRTGAGRLHSPGRMASGGSGSRSAARCLGPGDAESRLEQRPVRQLVRCRHRVIVRPDLTASLSARLIAQWAQCSTCHSSVSRSSRTRSPHTNALIRLITWARRATGAHPSYGILSSRCPVSAWWVVLHHVPPCPGSKVMERRAPHY
jgi:hypothetical protein